MITTHIIPVLKDNYAYVITTDAGDVAVIDPGEARPVKRFCDERNMKPGYIFLTHHHADHIAGAADLKAAYNARIVGPAAEAEHIYDLDIGVHEGHPLQLGEAELDFIETPGHTLGQINLYFPPSKTLFSGDTLFLMGCGRVFEGTMEMMHESLQKLKKLPEDTQIYCGHEYTMSNVRFALHVDPDNEDLQKRAEACRDLRAENKPTIPGTLADELKTNPFLRAGSIEEFADLRREKDRF